MLLGDYRGAAHDYCNINYHESTYIIILFHNLSGYDAHLLIRDVARVMKGSTRVLPNNMEKYIAIIKDVQDTRIKLKFLDSFRFLSAPLEKLASYLDATPILRKEFKNASDEQYNKFCSERECSHMTIEQISIN